MTGPRLTDQLQLAFAPVDDGLYDGVGEPERPVVTPSGGSM